MNRLEIAIAGLMKSREKCEVLSAIDSEQVLNEFFAAFPFTSWGQINWSNVKKRIVLEEIDPDRPLFQTSNDPIYILWCEDDLPVIKCSLEDALANIKDLKRVGAYATWLYCPTGQWVVEFYHHGDITLGFAEEANKDN